MRLRGTKKNVQARPIFFVFKSNMIVLYLLKIVFPKFDPLTVKGMALCVDLGSQCQNLFPLV